MKKKNKKEKSPRAIRTHREDKGLRQGGSGGGGRGSGVELSAEVVLGVAGGPESEQQQPSKGPLRLFSPLN